MNDIPKVILALMLLLSVTTAQAQKKKVNFYELDVIKGLFYQPNTIAPFSGTAVDEFPEGKKKLMVPIKDGKIDGKVTEWEKNGQKIYEATYDAGVQTGTEMQWYATGTKKLEISYLNGLADGLCTEWHKNGQKKSEGRFSGGKEEGEHLWWYSSGEKDQEAFYKNGLAEGVVKNWHLNGQLRLESNYLNGLEHGTTTEWYADGQKKTEARFKNGKEHGETRNWSKSGLPLGIQTYDQGKLVKDINYRSGNIRIAGGFIEVFNEAESFFMVRIEGDEVLFRPSDVITYAVDGKLLQLYHTPLSVFLNTDDTPDESAILMQYKDYETNYIADNTGAAIAPRHEVLKTANGKDYLYWHFVSPASKDTEQNPRTVLEEHYVSMVVNKRVLSLYSVVTNSDKQQDIKTMLKRLAEAVSVADARIDLNEIARQEAEKH